MHCMHVWNSQGLNKILHDIQTYYKVIGSIAGFTITDLDKGDITENGNIATYNQLSLWQEQHKGEDSLIIGVGNTGYSYAEERDETLLSSYIQNHLKMGQRLLKECRGHLRIGVSARFSFVEMTQEGQATKTRAIKWGTIMSTGCFCKGPRSNS